ncbi:MAG: DNA-binding GntR family transcriptional regulator [Gammaproteobacteria bacterium]|jgi:DNA-binding GntR family transcriptional regulator
MHWKENIPSEDEVLGHIEKAVLNHQLAPGTKLKEVELANLFGVKRGTIRKVLSRLAHARLVDQRPNRGATVAKPSAKEGRDLFAARRTIEASVLDTLINQDNCDHLVKLQALLKSEKQAYQLGDTEKALALSVNFHSDLAQMAGNTVLEEFLQDIIRRTPLVILTHINSDHQQCNNDEHIEIVEAIKLKDTRKAIELMNQHLLHLENQIDEEPESAIPDLATILGKVDR